MTKKCLLYLVLALLLATFISAVSITDDLHLNIQTTNNRGSMKVDSNGNVKIGI